VLFFSHGVMSEKDLAYGSIRDALLSAFPELLERIWSAFGSYYDLEKGTREETPGAYPIFEDVVQELVLELLDSGQDEGLVTRLFLFFEDMATASDKSGIAAAKSKGKRLGRPRVSVDTARIASLRASGRSWPQIAAELGLSVGTVYQAARRLSKIPSVPQLIDSASLQIASIGFHKSRVS
jgi:hypothetical protein